MIQYLMAVLGGLFLVLSACAPEPPGDPGIVIVNARVLDGSGDAPQAVSVRVVGDRIVAVGAVEPEDRDTIVDGAGLALTPGFIDTHSHHDIDLLDRPGALAAVSQGVTTIVAGQDGSQNFPLAEFFGRLEATPVAVNVASFAGHGTLRGQVMGDDYRRQASAAEIAAMADLLKTELEAGALGLSSGLEYDPGSFSSTAELIALAELAAEFGGRYISHIRSEDQYFWQAVDEAIGIGREARLPVRVTHVKLGMTRWWGMADELTDRLDESREKGVDVSVDVYPYRAWNTEFSWLVTLFPDRDLDRREGARYILDDMLSPEGILLATYAPEPAYNGMTIAEIAVLRESDPVETLIALLKAEDEMEGEGAESMMLGFAMDEPDIEAIMAWPHTVIGSDGELAGVHPRGFGAFTRFLGHYVRERNVVDLGEAVRKITSLPAGQVGIGNRGMIREGYAADLVLFDPDRVSDRATPEAPHLPSTGIDKVWVNGKLVYADGRITGDRPGAVIRRVPDRTAP